MSYPIVIEMTDEELISHLEQHHTDEIALSFKKRRMISDRSTWETYHDYWLHRASPRKPGHEHERYIWSGWEKGSGSMNRGWQQQTRCVCLEPPRHAPDCPGKLGVIVLGERHGPSARDRLWAGLDTAMDILKNPKEDNRPERPETVGMARGLALALACLLNPAEPDEAAIRKEAMRRWRERNNAS